jgi:hypothetical protein
MKKLLLALSILFAFTTVAFANVKTTTKKTVVSKEILKKQETCIVIRTYTDFDVVDGTVIWGDTVSYVDINVACLKLLLGAMGL